MKTTNKSEELDKIAQFYIHGVKDPINQELTHKLLRSQSCTFATLVRHLYPIDKIQHTKVRRRNDLFFFLKDSPISIGTYRQTIYRKYTRYSKEFDGRFSYLEAEVYHNDYCKGRSIIQVTALDYYRLFAYIYPKLIKECKALDLKMPKWLNQRLVE